MSASQPLDVIELLRTLGRHGVDCVVIGGVAVQAHGHRRTTRNLDVIVRPDAENERRLAEAVAELDGCPHGELSVRHDVPGAAAYEELRARALVVEVDGIEVALASRDDVIAMKAALRRPRDLEDIAVLTEEAKT